MPLTGKRARHSPGAAQQLPGNPLPVALAHSRRPGTVQRILRAAEQNFAERGLAGARIGAIARAARVNKALLYYYFASKEELHRFTLDTLFQQLRTQIGAALERPGSPREQLLRYINAYFDFMMAHPNYPRLFAARVDEPGAAAARDWCSEYLRPLHQRLTAVIRAGIAKGEFRRVDPRHTVLTLVAMTVFYFSAAPVLTELWQCNPLAPQARGGAAAGHSGLSGTRAVSTSSEETMKVSRFFFFLIGLFCIALVIYVLTTPSTKEIQLTGIITGTDVIVSPLVQGRLQKLLVDEGSEVKKGQLIAEIDPTELTSAR